jgi:hypothetical protein
MNAQDAEDGPDPAGGVVYPGHRRAVGGAIVGDLVENKRGAVVRSVVLRT